MMETAACLECDYEFGYPNHLPFHYKMKHKAKISKCASGDDILSGICLNKARSKARGNASKCSSSSSSSSFSFSPNSISNSVSDSVSNSNSDSCSHSCPTSNSSFTSNSSHTSSFNNNKIDLTNKVCHRYGVAKQITSFDKKKAICNKCNSTKVRCEYCSSIFSFNWTKGHIKKLIKK